MSNTPPASTRPSTKKKAPGAKRARHMRLKRIAIIVITLAVLGFAAGAAGLLKGLTKDDARAGTDQQLDALAEALRDHKARKGSLPPTLAERDLRSADDEISREDGWGGIIRYALDANAKDGFTLRSAGPDGTFDNDDDLTR